MASLRALRPAPRPPRTTPTPDMRLSFDPSQLALRAALAVAMCCAAFAGTAASASPLPAVTLYGTVTDAATGETLIGASVRVDGTSIGAATDFDGRYRIVGAPAGEQVLVVTYIGYRETRVPVTLADGTERRVDVELQLDVVEGEEVVITSQAEGQVAAINQQRSSNQIVNVVSAARIQELPDANAAESVGRLPGIAIQRDAGEGQKVIIRGLSPKYSRVTVNGVDLPSTDFEDRSTDLNMVSPELLAGIEVYKSLTPAQDADAIGGSVNFRLRGAPQGFQARGLAQGGYNGVSNGVGQYKTNLTLSNRFLDDRFGVFAQGSAERADRSSERVDTDYRNDLRVAAGDSSRVLLVDDVEFRNRTETRDRFGGSLLLDYRLPFGTVQLTNFVSRLDRNYVSRDNTFRTETKAIAYDLREADIITDLWSAALAGDFRLGDVARLDVTLNRSASTINTPYDSRARFLNQGALADSVDRESGPYTVPGFALESAEDTFFERLDVQRERGEEVDLTAQANLRVPYRLGSFLSGYFQTGGKLRNKDRVNDNTRDWLQLGFSGENGGLDELLELYPDAQLSPSGLVSIASFLDSERSSADILDDQFTTSLVIDRDLAADAQAGLRGVMKNAVWGDFQDYESTERVAAGYVMAEINLGPRVLLLPGVRYENTRTSYDTFFGRVPQELTDDEESTVVLRDTSSVQRYDGWFPMAQMRVRPTDWFDVRLSYTRSQARPDFRDYSPQVRINDSDQLLRKGTPELRPSRATNYDAYVTFYGNRLGLVSVGGFIKKIDGLIYDADTRLQGNTPQQSDSIATAAGYPGLGGYQILEPLNLPDPTYARGIEVEWQSNLTWLPGAFSGIVVNANVTRIFSETRFQRTRAVTVTEPPFFIPVTTYSPFFVQRQLIDQPDWVANLSLGYDLGPFSGRISTLYQEGSLTRFGNDDGAEASLASLLRFDAQVSYELFSQLTLYGQLNNFTNRWDTALQSTAGSVQEQENYGASFNLGLRYRPF